LQNIAREAAQPMTAYLKRSDSDDRYHLRWFTARHEMSFCGHATVACSHILFSGERNSSQSITYDTLAGSISVLRNGKEYEVSFPSDPPASIAEPTGLADALNARPLETWAGRHVVAFLENAKIVRDLQPDMTALRAISGARFGVGHVSVVAPSDDCSSDFVMRCFLPGVEDFATGSLACILTPLLAEKTGAKIFRYHQVPPGRGARMAARLEGARVAIQGPATTVSEGRWLL
jgi:PhzF family phenazine biosynthesis protein